METINMIFNQAPSGLNTLLIAFSNRKNSYTPGREYPRIMVSRPGVIADEAHIRAFNEICGIGGSDCLHILYPFTLAYPCIMRVLSARQSPVTPFRILNTRNSIVLRRRIRPDERLDIDCHSTTPRMVPKGLELDVVSVISSRGERAWENTTTYFLPGNFGPPDPSYRAARLQPLNDDAETIAEWYLRAKDRFRFGRISGDSNGLHYWYYYARMMGFRRDFAQPIRVVARCVSSLPGIEPDRPALLDFHLKGPVYYESTLSLKSVHTGNGSRFNLYCSGNDKPVICGIMHTR